MRGQTQEDPSRDEKNVQNTVTNTPVKMWEELSIEEKIERMHEVVKQMQYSNSETYSRVETLISLVEQHVHDEDGKAILVKNIRQEFYLRNMELPKTGSMVPERYF